MTSDSAFDASDALEVPPAVAVIVAAKDAAGSVGPTVAALRALCPGSTVVVVDDGSVDSTTDEARAAGATVLRLETNRGKGGAVAAGIATAPDADVYLLVDADVGSTAAAAGPLLEPVLTGSADMTVGVLPPAGSRAGFGWVKRMAGGIIRRATGVEVEAPLSGQRAVRGPLLRRLTLASRFGLETALTVDVVRAGGRVVEVPIAIDHRHTGRRAAGFRHRAGQGVDILRAAWPRLTTPGLRMTAIVLAVVVAGAGALWSGRRAAPLGDPLGRASHVVILGAPHLGWSDIEAGSAPNLSRRLGAGAVGTMTVRTVAVEPSIEEAYASLGAGARVEVPPGALDPTSVDGGLVVGGLAAVRRANEREHAPSLPGALGDALHAAGRRTAVVGTDAAPAVMDSRGTVDLALQGATATDDVVAATAQALAEASVVAVDPGRLAKLPRGDAESEPADTPARRRALGEFDELVGGLASSLPPTARLIVAPVVPPGGHWRLTPLSVSGAGGTRARLISPSTRRAGLATLTDLAPTVLDSLGLASPAPMIGRPLRQQPGEPGIGAMIELDRAAFYRERIYLPIVIWFIAVQALAYGLAIATFARRRAKGRALPALRVLSLGIAAFPLATFLLRAVPGVSSTGFSGFLILMAIDAAIVRAVWRRRTHRLSALGWILTATVAVLLVDVATGGRLQQASLMGYSPYTATRYFGIGNTAFAILTATTILASAIHLEQAPRRREALLGVAGLFVLVILVEGAPSLGDDVGGILTLVPVLSLVLLSFSGRRVSPRLIAAAGVLTVVVLGSAAAVDLLRPVQARTHLGRLVIEVAQDGWAPLGTVIARKAATNLRVLRATVWTWVVPIVTVLTLYLLVWQRRGMELLPRGSPRRVGAVGALAAGLLGFAVNDSGVIVTALVLVYTGPFLVLLALPWDGDRVELLEPVSPAGAPAAVAP